MDVSSKKAVVFGGTSGIGLATTRMLAAEGATVVTISRDPSKAGDLPSGVTVEACDVTDAAAVEALLNKLAPYDILVSAATGGARAVGPFLEMDMDGYKGSFAKLWGYAHVVRFGAKHVTDGGSITLVSGAPARNCRPGQIAISSVGGAVEAMARAVAKEVAPRIRINVVSPGTIDTPMVALQGEERTTAYTNMTKNNLVPRAGTAEEVAEGLMFVIKNDFVTGTTVDVDGGWLIA
ncbi:MAG: SDR family oxidoreductase [Hyphomicrobiaceae bacterium TMED74]|nr:short-chain dehydrogenase [Filomicrobium sp.]RPG37929.1 MAG: SDR family oxidoreductase [Hyphomicrobiaceae bacterium TMED74]